MRKKNRLRRRAVLGIKRVLGHQTVETQWQAHLLAGRASVGRRTYGAPLLQLAEGDDQTLSIGAFTSISFDVAVMLGGNHRTDWVTTFPLRQVFDQPGALRDGHPSSKGPVTIGNDVWIGRGARILSGVSIGDGAVIGAHSVVARSVRPYAVVVGNPGTETRRRFPDHVVESLQRIAWWEWPDDVIVERVGHLCQPDLDAFCATYDPFFSPTTPVPDTVIRRLSS